MKKLIDLLTCELEQAFEKAGYDKKYAKVTLSNLLSVVTIPILNLITNVSNSFGNFSITHVPGTPVSDAVMSSEMTTQTL